MRRTNLAAKLCALALTFLLAAGAAAQEKADLAGRRGNTVGNIAEYGAVVDCEEGIFYAHNGILRFEAGDPASAREIYASPAMYLNYYGGWLYFSDSYDGGKLCRIRPDGTGREELAGMNCEAVSVVDDRLYFVVSGDSAGRDGVYSAALDGSDARLLSKDGAARLAVYAGSLYYIDAQSGRLCRMGLDGRGKETLLKKNCLSFDFFGETLYVATVEGIYQADLEGNLKARLYAGKAQSLLTDGENLFFSYPDFFGGAGVALSMIDIDNPADVRALLEGDYLVPCIGLAGGCVLAQALSAGYTRQEVLLIDVASGQRTQLPPGSFSVG